MLISELTTPIFDRSNVSEKLYRTLAMGPGYASEVNVFKNPTRVELERMVQWGTVRAWLVGRDMLAFDPGIHAHVFRKLDLPKTSIPLMLYPAVRDVIATVTDASNNTIWRHSPNVKPAIMNHPHMNRLFDQIEVRYYDEDVVGDWEKEYA